MEKLDKLKLIQTYLDKLDSDFNVSSPTEIEDHIRDFESDDIEIDDINKIYDELEIELERAKKWDGRQVPEYVPLTAAGGIINLPEAKK